MSKTLRITLSGICTVTPGLGDGDPGVIDAIMPAARAGRISHDGAGVIARHHPYICVAGQSSGRAPDLLIPQQAGALTVYLFDRARVTIELASATPLRYFVGETPLPAAPDDTSAGDMRWFADIGEISPDARRLRRDCDPASGELLNPIRVAGFVRFEHGEVRTNFPCGSQVQIIALPDGSDLSRPFASELIVTMEYPEDLDSILLRLSALDPNATADDVRLAWLDNTILDVRIGNDTLDEIVRLGSADPCIDQAQPPLRDNDFELHYDLLVEPPALPLPARIPGETRHNGCLGVTVSRSTPAG